ncbi:MAG TPA: (d)CMP kinase [Candidatus Nitrosocosmicus sp.]|jgi:cytidylate kinase|nr:(d)CMP kinase [Candidatus Nitrosocosmicus sp.]
MSTGDRREPVITIDGPAGAGKSTAARELARRLGFRLLDTGAMYRALAWAVREAGIPAEDGPALRALLASTTIELIDDGVRVNGRDVTGEIRTPAIGELTSLLTMLRPVREKLTPVQRALAGRGGVVLEGRDTGSVVCPDAEVKFYLDADLDARARRRQEELAVRGVRLDLSAVREEVARRDRQDMGRAIAPLVRPADAVVVDTTGLDEDAVVERLLEAVERARCSTRS